MSEPNSYNGYSESGWDSNGYGGETGYGYDTKLAQYSSNWDAGNTAYNTDNITNSYAENPYEANVFDNAYTETFSNPNPTHDYSSSTGFEQLAAVPTFLQGVEG